jgi:hypothetical protein
MFSPFFSSIFFAPSAKKPERISGPLVSRRTPIMASDEIIIV